MINISFYLLTPEANNASQLYVSISNKEQRLRFATGESFLTAYCNIRKIKGKKELVKKNTPFYFPYTKVINDLREQLYLIELELQNKGMGYTLGEIKEEFYKRTGKIKIEKVTLETVFQSFIEANRGEWSENTLKKVNGTLNHLKEHEKEFPFIIEQFTVESWVQLRDIYFVATKGFSNPSTNKYLKIVKQFLKFAKKKGILKSEIDFDELKFLDEIEPFKIALKEHEVESLFDLDLSNDERLSKVRDLFGLEILTGQRFSDIEKLLDVRSQDENTIKIYQKKTKAVATIPLHPRLKSHLAEIFEKYPDGLPVISNQKFNSYLKEICQKAGFTKEHSWTILVGKKEVIRTNFRYNLITSHTGRRTFCTLALNSGINAELIMRVTGHKTYDQFREYVKVDDSDLGVAFNDMFRKRN